MKKKGQSRNNIWTVKWLSMFPNLSFRWKNFNKRKKLLLKMQNKEFLEAVEPRNSGCQNRKIYQDLTFDHLALSSLNGKKWISIFVLHIKLFFLPESDRSLLWDLDRPFFYYFFLDFDLSILLLSLGALLEGVTPLIPY